MNPEMSYEGHLFWEQKAEEKKKMLDLLENVSDYISSLSLDDQEKAFGYLLADLQSKGEYVLQDIRLAAHWWTGVTQTLHSRSEYKIQPNDRPTKILPSIPRLSKLSRDTRTWYLRIARVSFYYGLSLRINKDFLFRSLLLRTPKRS